MVLHLFFLSQDERSRMLRRTIMRYINLAFIITMRLCSVTVKKRFPTSEHLVEAGCLLPHEKDLLDELDDKSPYWWVFARRYALRSRCLTLYNIWNVH